MEHDLLETKTCNSCGEMKLKYTDFTITKYSNGNERIRNQCKTCRCTEQKQRRLQNIEDYKARDKSYYENNKQKCIIANKNRRQIMRDTYNFQKRVYYQNNKDKIKQYHINTRAKRNLRIREKRKNDVQARIINSLRSRFRRKDNSTMALLGCSLQEFRHFISTKFSSNMTWDNYGSVWDIDHVIPLAFFDLTSGREQGTCFHWTNLQPLLKHENYKKSSKIIPSMIKAHFYHVQNFLDINKGYQTNIEKCWWQRVKLWYGKNPNFQGDYTSLLQRIIRNWDSFKLS